MNNHEMVADEYFEGVAAYPDGQCPYTWNQFYRYCWFMAGFHDARRGLA